jgi:hypothetical protein
MRPSSKVRLYALAKELKLDTKSLIEEVRREGIDIRVPSNKISKELAEKIRNKYLPTKHTRVKRLVKVAKRAPRTEHRAQQTSTSATRHFEAATFARALSRLAGALAPAHEVPMAKRKGVAKVVRENANQTVNVIGRPAVGAPASVDPDSNLFSQVKGNLSEESFGKLQRKNFGELRELIDDCLRGTARVSEEDLSLVTTDKDTLLAYARILEFKIADPKQKGKPNISFRRKIIARIVEDIKALDGRMPWFVAKRLNWELLPPGTNSFPQIVRHFDYLSRRRTHVVYDIVRLHKVYSLHPDEIYVGIEEFEGYIVFYFSQPSIAVLECPVTGNAIYVFGENWKSLSRLSKSTLLNSGRSDVDRVIHNDGWFSQLESLIATRKLRAGLRQEE